VTVMRYEVRVAGRMSELARSAFREMAASVPPETIIYGEVADDAHLHGLLELCQNLGLQVVAPGRADLAGEIRARRAQHLVDPPQLGVLPRTRRVLRQHLGGRPIVPLPGVGLGLAHPVPQGFWVHVQLLAQPPKRRPRLGLPVPPNCMFPQLTAPECGEHSDDVTRGPTDVHPREVVRFATRRSSVPHRDGRFDGCAKRIRRRSGGRGCGGGMLAGLICLVLPVSQAARHTAISDRRHSRSSQHHPQPAGSAPVRLRVLCGRGTRVPDEAATLGLSGAWRRYLDM
jgi:hypothetical protein